MSAVGIDLGTTNSAVAIMKGRPTVVEDDQGNRTLPSAVGWDPDLEELIVGGPAKNDPVNFKTVLSVKRKMGTKERLTVGRNAWLPEDVSAEILKVLKKQVEDKTGEPVTEAIITIPAYFQMAAIDATRRAGELAGLKVQQLLAEPSAAIMAYGPREDEKILVYDLGGGTFDVTIVECFAGTLTTKAVFGNNFLGGDDFDQRLMDFLRDQFKKQHNHTIDYDKDPAARSVLKREAERTKIELSKRNGVRVSIPKVLETGGRPLGIEVTIKREEFNAMIQDLITGSFKEVEKALAHAKYTKRDIDTVLLVGGSTYVPLVQETVRDFFGKEPNKTVNPDLAVALGAAASLLSDSGATGTKRHIVTVGSRIPEKTPDERLSVSGRTSPRSQVKVSGGGSPVNVTANEEGYYKAQVPLKQGMNALSIMAVAPDGTRASIDPEPVVFDPTALPPLDLPPPPAPVRSHALSVSCIMGLGNNRNMAEAVSVIIQPQTELPAVSSADHFGTNRENQPELVGSVLEGDLPVASLNTKLAEISLKLPPNLPANEQVVVHFTIDESSMLTAKLEVPSVNRSGTVTVDLKSPSSQIHIYQQVENLLTQIGNRLRPEERAGVEQIRVGLDDLSKQFRHQERNNDTDGMWASYNRIADEGKRLKAKLDELRRKYA